MSAADVPDVGWIVAGLVVVFVLIPLAPAVIAAAKQWWRDVWEAIRS